MPQNASYVFPKKPKKATTANGGKSGPRPLTWSGKAYPMRYATIIIIVMNQY